ncbi:MAG: DUF962 domain-containing protein [Saprospiraceae bacterium]|nr:DUF962 domain-containing protein [Saprospiraceae bacterium]
MRKIDYLFNTYGESHQNVTNKLIHWFCIPAILFSLVGLLMLIPVPFIVEENSWLNWGTIIMFLASIYYFSVSRMLMIGFILVFGAIVYCNVKLNEICIHNSYSTWIVLLLIFIIAWIGQFIGHKIEGKKPSFLQDIQYLLIGPAWLLSFIYKKLGLKY